MTFNLLEEQRNRDNSSEFLDVRADFRIDAELFNGFTISPSFRYERGAGNADNYRSMSLPSHRNLINDFYVNDTYQIPLGTDYERTQQTYEGWTMRNTFSYENTFGKHDINLFGGIEYNKRFSESAVNRAFGYDRQATLYVAYDEFDLFRRQIRNFNNGTIDGNVNRANTFKNTSNDDDRFVSYFTNLAYTFNKKYLINASYRVDQANIWGSDPDFRYKPLWSVGAGWRIAEEDFINDVSWINSLTLRGTYGLGGNTLISNASPYATASSRTNTYRDSYFFSRLSRPANPGLKWEETATTNFALDFGLFNNRLSGSLEYYVRKSSDVYGSNVLDPTVGFTSALVNYAEIENKGIELQLNATIIETQDFGWNLRANFNKNKNIITKVNTSNQNPSSLTGGFAYAEGVPVSSLWNYKFAGLDSNGEATFFDRNGVATHWDDARTDFEVEDIEFSGSRVPQVYGGLSTTVRYKGFDLTANLNFAADYVFSYTTDRLNTGYGTGNNNFASPFQFSNIRLDQVWGNRWRNPGDENLTNVPRLFYNGLNPDTGNIERTFWQSRQDAIWSDSDLHIHKGDYIRVQDIILGYTFSNKVLNNTFLNNLRLTMQVTNPFLWVANDLGVDPTAVARYSNAYTNLTRFTFGVRANF